VRRALIAAFVIVFVFGIAFALAGDENCQMAKKTGCCASKAEAQGTGASAYSDDEKEQAAHVCPDVTGRTALQEFHEAMHPMHMALGAEDFEKFDECLPTLMKASKRLVDYKCDGYEKCPESCRKNFDGKKAELIQAVDQLSEACKGKDKERITADFDVMHEAYITFANTCVKPETEKAEEKKAQEEETE
jgi:hypothetical protein